MLYIVCIKLSHIVHLEVKRGCRYVDMQRCAKGTHLRRVARVFKCNEVKI